MKVILLENISSLGALGEVVTVRPGYARNYLFPQSKAERATPKSIADFDLRRAEIEKQQQKQQQLLESARDQLAKLTLKVKTLSSPDGNLYGSITAQIIAQALNEQKIIDLPIKRNQILLKEGPIKSLGEHAVQILIDSKLPCDIKISVVSDTSQKN